ncbi:MAG: type IX secretion system membrane protein PorP/SprF [Bacteroidia bacterium]|nr:type IX secretion system membrane protein PorP/SprF [Bacteroidia bacterium]
MKLSASYFRDWSLSMGISAGVFTRSVDGSLFEAVTTIDPSIQYNMERVTKPDANVGFEFQNTHFIFSISSTHCQCENMGYWYH